MLLIVVIFIVVLNYYVLVYRITYLYILRSDLIFIGIIVNHHSLLLYLFCLWMLLVMKVSLCPLEVHLCFILMHLSSRPNVHELRFKYAIEVYSIDIACIFVIEEEVICTNFIALSFIIIFISIHIYYV